MENNQPTNAVKLATLRGENTGWSYSFNVPPVSHDQWSNQNWVDYIGDHWYPTKQAETVQLINNNACHNGIIGV